MSTDLPEDGLFAKDTEKSKANEADKTTRDKRTTTIHHHYIW
jgi:hypothetical protein